MLRKTVSAVLSAMLVLVLFAGAVSAQSQASQDAFQALLLLPLKAEYQAAVANAQANLAHIQTPPANPGIWDITADNTNLIWSGEPGNSMVLVSTFTKGSYYSGNTSGQAISAAVDLWVTPAPQAYKDVKAEDPAGAALNPKLALSEYLGLPPVNSNDTVVSFWVSPASLVRPAIDPGVTSHELETSFPITLQTVPLTPAANVPKDPPASGLSSSPDYVSWFLNREANIFRTDIQGGPYPWTGLGYTYDWNPLATDVVGGSEFIAVKGSTAILQSATPISKYFQ